MAMRPLAFFFLLPLVQSHVNQFEAIVKEVNSNHLGWKARVPSWNTLDEVSAMCGSRGQPSNYGSLQRPTFHMKTKPLSELPIGFDARETWPNCKVIGHVRDQGVCGSCWAHAAAEAAESVRCIVTGEDLQLSPDDLGGCCKWSGSDGCAGGHGSSALRYIIGAPFGPGIVTGGDYPKDPLAMTGNLGCKPYSLPPCSINNATAHYSKCVKPTTPNVLTCNKTCTNTNYSTPYLQDYKGENEGGVVAGLAYRDDNCTHMMTAIMETGPIIASMTVFADFPTYASGVYRHVTGQALGGHAILIVGWGVDKDTPYWLVKNSWNKEWGIDGFFKILRGNNEAGIELGDVASITFKK